MDKFYLGTGIIYIFRIYHKDYFTDRIEEGEIDPRIASIPTRLDEAAEQLVRKHILDRLRSVYQVTYRHPSKLITYRNDIINSRFLEKLVHDEV